MTAAEIVIPLTGTYHSIMITTIRTDTRVIPTRKVTQGKGPIPASVMEKTTEIGITIISRIDITVKANTESWMTTETEIIGQT